MPGREAERHGNKWPAPGPPAKSGYTVHQPLLPGAAAEPPQLCKRCQRDLPLQGLPALGPRASVKGRERGGKSPSIPIGYEPVSLVPHFQGSVFPTQPSSPPFFSPLACKSNVIPGAPSKAWCAQVWGGSCDGWASTGATRVEGMQDGVARPSTTVPIRSPRRCCLGADPVVPHPLLGGTSDICLDQPPVGGRAGLSARRARLLSPAAATRGRSDSTQRRVPSTGL